MIDLILCQPYTMYVSLILMDFLYTALYTICCYFTKLLVQLEYQNIFGPTRISNEAERQASLLTATGGVPTQTVLKTRCVDWFCQSYSHEYVFIKSRLFGVLLTLYCHLSESKSIPHICHFSPQRQFLVQFFSTQKCVNRDKTDFLTKVRKSWQNHFYNKTA